MDPFGAMLIAGFIGAIVGAAVTFVWRYSERKIYDIPSSTPVIDEDVNRLLSLLSSSAVVISNDDRIVQASAPTYLLGIIRDHALVSTELLDIVHYVRRTGESRDAELQLTTNNRDLHVAVRVAPFTSQLIIMFIDDRTREHAVEKIRKDFVANVSHELKTPIGALIALAEVIHEAKNDPEAIASFAKRMGIEAERLNRLVARIIELSRLQDDELLGRREKFDAETLINDAVQTCQSLATTSLIDITTDIDPDITLWGEKEQIQVALTNLIENAIAYSRANSHVLISAHTIDSRVEITVTDQGVGIPSEEVDRIFERFYRLDPSRNTATGGTGLGLSIVKHVMASHGGEIKVWSVPGEGSSFTLVFPERKS